MKKDESNASASPTKRYVHKLRCLVIWLLATKMFVLWMAYVDADPPIAKIPKSSFKVSYTSLNKFGNDTSGCPKKPSDKVVVGDHFKQLPNSDKFSTQAVTDCS